MHANIMDYLINVKRITKQRKNYCRIGLVTEAEQNAVKFIAAWVNCFPLNHRVKKGEH